MANADELKRLQEAIDGITKKHGKGAVMRLSDKGLDLTRISSGVFPIDEIIGGGYPLGRIVELYGPESSGKTTIALKAIASFQKAGHICAFIDAEHALDPDYAIALGVDVDNLYVSQPDCGETALEIAEILIRSGSIGLVVVDSVAALVPRSEIDGEMGAANVGVHARLMSQAMRKLTGIVSTSQSVVIFINQLRDKIGNAYGGNETTTGGRALKFYASIRLDVRKKATVQADGDAVANTVTVKSVKNKTYPPFRSCEFNINYGTGPDEVGYVVDRAVEAGLMTKAGAWYSMEGFRGHGKRETVEWLTNDCIGKEKYEDLKNAIQTEKVVDKE